MKALNSTDTQALRSLRKRTATIFKLQGRRPRILITRIPPNGSEQIVKSVAAAFADIGFDVDIHLSDLPPAAMARIAVENDVHVIGIPSFSSAAAAFVAKLLTSLDRGGAHSIQVVGWVSAPSADLNPVYRPQDEKFRIFGPETSYNDVVNQILDGIE
jgi:methylmalonyl-CoA mutase